MAVIQNRLTEIGDVILIRTETPLAGLLSLDSFSDDVAGETATRFFTKEFRYANDGLTFSGYIDLTNSNLQNVTIQALDTILIEYRYTRSGTDASGELVFNEIQLEATVRPGGGSPLFDNSVFGDYLDFNDPNIYNWAINVLSKIQDKSIIAKFLDGDDFTDFFRAVCLFYAYHVNLGRVFEDFYDIESLLSEYVSQRGLFLSDANDLDDMRLLASNLLSEFAKRGTVRQIMPSDSENEIDGEVLRLIGWSSGDEFIFGQSESKFIGWNLNNSSPEYRGTRNQNHINKGYEDTVGIEDPNNYPVSIGAGSSVSVILEGSVGENVLSISNVQAGEFSGIRYSSNNEYLIPVDSRLDYEISFRIRRTPSVIDRISFECQSFDQNMNPTNLESVTDGSPSNEFFVRQSWGNASQYYFVSGIVWGEGRPNNPDSALSIGIGKNLRMGSDTKFIVPSILLDNRSEASTFLGNIRIYDLKVRPLSLEYSKAFIDNRFFIDSVFENKSGLYSDSQINSILRKYFIPYNTQFKTQFL